MALPLRKELQFPADQIVDLAPKQVDFRSDALHGLELKQKQVSPKFLYDSFGSSIFEQICQTPEYYLTRKENDLLLHYRKEISQWIGEDSILLEYGPGSGEKARILLEFIESPLAYLPIDISRDSTLEAAQCISQTFPDLRVIPVIADFMQPLDLAPAFMQIEGQSNKRKTALFLGSTLGNMEPQEIPPFFKRALQQVGSNGGLLLGIDLVKTPYILEMAYNDLRGVTADFNLNLLSRMNRELGANFNLKYFRHQAFFNKQASRIEMHLKSRKDQDVQIEHRKFHFRMGETIHTENSYKYTVDQISQLALQSGFKRVHPWTDDQNWYGLLFCSSN